MIEWSNLILTFSQLQPQQQGARPHQSTAAPNRKPSTRTAPTSEEPPSPSTSSGEDEQEEVQDQDKSQTDTETPPVTVLNAQKTPSVQPTSETSNPANSIETEAMQIDSGSASSNENLNTPAKETAIEEAIRVTRARLRRARSAPAVNRRIMESAPPPT